MLLRRYHRFGKEMEGQVHGTQEPSPTAVQRRQQIGPKLVAAVAATGGGSCSGTTDGICISISSRMGTSIRGSRRRRRGRAVRIQAQVGQQLFVELFQQTLRG